MPDLNPVAADAGRKIAKICFPESNALAYFAQTFYSPEEGFY
jgi:hypothetical protein